MKVAIISDTHFGARSDNQVFIDHFIRFFDEVFFPYLVENNIDTVLHLGDLMDRRKFVNFNTLNNFRTRVMDKFEELGIKFYCLIGNHDVYYRNTNGVNSLKELFSNRYENFTVIEDPITLQFDGTKIDMIPWINKENHDDIMKFIKKSKSSICCGHFELDGYQVLRGVNFEGGMSDKVLSRYEMVLSGHFHNRQEKNNVRYVGTPYQITFSDLAERKGFHVLDTANRSIEFIVNPNDIFLRFDYDDVNNGPMIESFVREEHKQLTNKYIRMYVKNKKNPYLFDQTIDRLYADGVISITIVEESTIDQIKDDDVVDLAQDTLSLINNEIDNLDHVDNKGKLKNIVRELYFEALSQ